MSVSGEDREPAEDLLARFVEAARYAGFDRELFEALHPGAASHLEELLGAPSAAQVEHGSPSGAPSAAASTARAVVERLAVGPAPGGRYRTEEEVARGGQGAILRVWDESLGRHLAMKVTHASQPEQEVNEHTHVTRSLGRFVEEARVTAQLDHPGIVPVHEFGKDPAGRLYFTMKLVKGRDLKEIFRLVSRGEEGWTRTRVLTVLLRMCEGMAYAHSKGVIHRDLKPGNVMVGRFGEVYVMDWGLARILDQEDTRDVRIRPPAALMTTQVHSLRHDGAAHDEDSPLITMDGDVVGTPAYMSPEQALGDLERMGPHSDVYSAGAMLYHLLAGHPPYVPAGRRLHNYAIWARVQEGPPPVLHEQAADIPAELLAICDKAMAREPGRRYRDMSELAADLSAYLEHRVVRAYETGAVAELRKWIERNRPLATALSTALVAVVGGLAAVGWVERREREHADRLRVAAQASEARAVQSAREARLQERRAEAERENVLRLSAFQQLDQLHERARSLWPAVPERVAELRAWEADAEALHARVPGLLTTLAELRARAVLPPPAERERLRRAHPRAAELEAARTARAALRRVLGLPEETSLDAVAVPASDTTRDARALNEEAWSCVGHDRVLFGREPLGLLLAERAVDAPLPEDLSPDERAALPTQMADTLAWAYFANGLDSEALAASEAMLREAPTRLQPTAAAWNADLRAAVERRRAAAPWELQRLERRCAALEWELAGARLETEEDRWWHEQLVDLVERIEALFEPRSGLMSDGTAPGTGWAIPRRLELATELEPRTRTGEEARRLWEQASQEIAADPAYGGLVLTPQRGLLPLGPDPASGLWEFAAAQTGDVPARDRDGRLRVGATTAVVLVLVPAGRFLMGAQARDERAPGYDAAADGEEGPVHAVELGPFFLSKYELTQAQWTTLDGQNPSLYPAGGFPPVPWSTHPVEMVSWDDCARVLPRVELRLPTEAEWEYAARAHTSDPWAGVGQDQLVQAANLVGTQDGQAQHAPVDASWPNAFGFHGTLGNVHEWCRDHYAPEAYLQAAAREPLFERSAPGARVLRGGSYGFTPQRARVSARLSGLQSVALHVWGVRPARSIQP